MDLRELDWMDVAAAFGKMSAEEQAMLESLADQLVQGLQARHGKPFFSRSQAMELLAKIGVWMIGVNYESRCNAVAVVLPACAEA